MKRVCPLPQQNAAAETSFGDATTDFSTSFPTQANISRTHIYNPIVRIIRVGKNSRNGRQEGICGFCIVSYPSGNCFPSPLSEIKDGDDSHRSSVTMAPCVCNFAVKDALVSVIKALPKTSIFRIRQPTSHISRCLCVVPGPSSSPVCMPISLPLLFRVMVYVSVTAR